MSEIQLHKIHCIRCGKLAQVSKTQSKQTEGLQVRYCYDKTHKRIKIRLIQKKQRKIIRTERMSTTKEYDESFNMRNLRCVCGHRLQFDKRSSYISAAKVTAYCFNNEVHRVKLLILSKLMKEPDFDELIEVFVKPSDR